MDDETKKKVASEEFQDKCWKLAIEILEDKYNQKFKIVGVKNEEKNENQMGKR